MSKKRSQTGMSAPQRSQTGMSAPPRKAKVADRNVCATMEIGPAPGISDVTSVADGNRVVRLEGPPPWSVSQEDAMFLYRHRPHMFVTAAEWERYQAALARAAEAAATADNEGKGGN